MASTCIHSSGSAVRRAGTEQLQLDMSLQVSSTCSLCSVVTHLLLQDKSAGGTLSVNTDAVIEEVLSEALGWERLRLSLPFPAAEVAKQRERLRKARIHAANVARAYNQVRNSPLLPFYCFCWWCGGCGGIGSKAAL